MRKNKKIVCAGISLFNGIEFTSSVKQVHITRINGNLNASTSKMYENKSILSKIPIIRGILGMKSQIGDAAPTFMESAGEKQNNARGKTILLYVILIFLCVTIPMTVSLLFSENIRWIAQLVIIFFEFLAYIAVISLCSGNQEEIDTLFKYHGAEHKVVNAFEKKGLDGLTFENVKKETRIHKRCGGNLLSYFFILTMLTTLLPIDDMVIKTICMIALGILNVGVAYEIVNMFSKLPKPLDIINYPASLIQYVTTKEPSDDMIELAIYGMREAVREENMHIDEYVKLYINERLKDKKEEDIDKQDIYSILSYVTNTDRNYLYLNKSSYGLTLNQIIKADKLIDKYYNEDYPLQYITHRQYFYNEDYYVDENVLIPRADSEILVEKAIEYINKDESIKDVIDLCTGSGALGISIAKNSNINKMLLIDISCAALKVAKTNISRNKAREKVSAIYSDLLEQVIEHMNNIKNNKELSDEERENLINEAKVDMIVSNPPYIKSSVICSLDMNVQKEPHLALDGGESGLDFYNRIIKEAKEVLRDNGILIFEIGYDQLQDLKDIINENKEYKLLESVKDYGGNDRVVICRFLGK